MFVIFVFASEKKEKFLGNTNTFVYETLTVVCCLLIVPCIFISLLFNFFKCKHHKRRLEPALQNFNNQTLMHAQSITQTSRYSSQSYWYSRTTLLTFDLCYVKPRDIGRVVVAGNVTEKKKHCCFHWELSYELMNGFKTKIIWPLFIIGVEVWRCKVMSVFELRSKFLLIHANFLKNFCFSFRDIISTTPW